MTADKGTRGNQRDFAYTMDSSQDGWWSGTWGVMRSYNDPEVTLYELPNSMGDKDIANGKDFNGVCPKGAPTRKYDVTAVLANAMLENAAAYPGINLTAAGDPEQADIMHEGSLTALDPNGGTLVYNPRTDSVPSSAVDGEMENGPLHDPTAILFVRTADIDKKTGKLKADAPVEPLVLRANAGDCLQVKVRNALPGDLNGNGYYDDMPDLAGYNTLLQMVNRDRLATGKDTEGVQSLTTFNNNQIRPSSYVGLHPQLVTYDVTRADGVQVGLNTAEQMAAPGGEVDYVWYAGHHAVEEGADKKGNTVYNLAAYAVEYGGANLTPTDKIKQGQKGMIGALVVEPEGADWPDGLRSLESVRDRQQPDPYQQRKTRADVVVTESDGSAYNDLVVAVQKGNNHRFADGSAVPNIASEGQGLPEDSHDAGQKGINYGSEPAWFRFGLKADAPLGNNGGGSMGAVPNAHEYHTSALVGEDPATPVFTAAAGSETRMRLLEPTGVGRGSTFTQHGHTWQRDPYVCKGDSKDGLDGKCDTASVGSSSIGTNPVGMYLGGQEGVQPGTHFEIRLERTGGANAVPGDYLFQDQAAFGHTDGIWGILRVE